MAQNGGSIRNGGADNDDDHQILSMELESLHPAGAAGKHPQQPHTVRPSRSTVHPLTQLWMLIKLHMEYYPRISSVIGLATLALLMYLAIEASKPPLARHKLNHEYASLDMHYNFKASQMDHWCLFGGDSACRCDDFTEPVPREEAKGWLDVHRTNKQAIRKNFDYDVVFFGDEMVELWNGRMMGLPARPDGPRIRKLFNQTFNKDAGGDMNGLALGIQGDSSANLLWRLQHGEMTKYLQSKVWWLWIGTNDLARGGCSEEATILGILRAAEEIAIRNPYTIVVIMGILPRSSRPDGSLEPRKSRHHFFGKHHSESYYADQARKEFLLWPSIQRVNKELEAFCAQHEHMVYFDASSFFLGSIGNERYHSTKQQIVTELMPDYAHPSFEGYKVLAEAMLGELQRIILEEDEGNDVEEKDGT